MKYIIDGEFDVSEEGLWTNIKHFFRIPSGTFEFMFVDLPTKYKYKLLGQVFCRPAPNYKMPRFPTVSNVDNSKIIPYWATTKTVDTRKSIDHGMSYVEVLKQWTKFADLMEGISKLSSTVDAGLEIDKLFKKIFSVGDFDQHKGTSAGIRLKVVENVWPSDAWFKDTSYSIVDKLEKQANRITRAAKIILNASYTFKTDSEALECSGKRGMLKRLIVIYKKTTTKCYNFSSSLYKGTSSKE